MAISDTNLLYGVTDNSLLEKGSDIYIIDAEGTSTTLQTFSVSTRYSSTTTSGSIKYMYSDSRYVSIELLDFDVSNYTQIGFQFKVTRPSAAATNKFQASAKLTSHMIGVSA